MPNLLFELELVTELADRFYIDRRIEPYLLGLMRSSDIDEQYSASCVLQLVKDLKGQCLAAVSDRAMSDQTDPDVRRTCTETLAYNNKQLALAPIFKMVRRGVRGYANILTLLDMEQHQIIRVIRNLSDVLNQRKQPSQRLGCIEEVEQAVINLAARL